MRLTMTAAVTARWGHRVGGLIHTHAWTVEATVEGPCDAPMVFPADDLERILSETVRPWEHHYLTDTDVGRWKGYDPIVWDREPTVEEISRRLWECLTPEVPGLASLALIESTEFDRCRRVQLFAG
ncbi:MAG: 6-pyruvoyl tetrahydropterin synthase family protein [Acidimicrobiales bacterium]